MFPGRLIIAILALVLVQNPVQGAQAPPDYIETLVSGAMNWKTGKISATGFSEPLKKKAGKQTPRNESLAAARKLAGDTFGTLLKKLRISGAQTVADVMAAEPSIAEKIEEMVRSVPVVKQNFLSDGAAEIVIEMSIHGGFSQLILPADIRQIEAIQPVDTTPAPSGQSAAGSPGRPPAGSLVIDARGLGAAPAMTFNVLNENGKPVYGAAYVSREYAVQWGMAEYVRRMPTVAESDRVTVRPLVVKGLRAVGPGRTDIIISNADVMKLKGAVENLILLRQGRVVVILD